MAIESGGWTPISIAVLLLEARAHVYRPVTVPAAHLEAAIVAGVGDGGLVLAGRVQEDAGEALHLQRLVLIGLALDLQHGFVI